MTFAEHRARVTDTPTYRVVIPDVPVRRFLELQAHLDALVDELMAVHPDPCDERNQLLPLVEGLTGTYEPGRRATRTAAARAALDGGDTFTLEIDVPLAAADAVPVWNRLLDAADWAGSRGLLRTHPATPDVVDLRRWIASEVARALPDGSAN